METVKIGNKELTIYYHRSAASADRAYAVVCKCEKLKIYELKEKGILRDNILDLTDYYTHDSIPDYTYFLKHFCKINKNYKVTYFEDDSVITVE